MKKYSYKEIRRRLRAFARRHASKKKKAAWAAAFYAEISAKELWAYEPYQYIEDQPD